MRIDRLDRIDFLLDYFLRHRIIVLRLARNPRAKEKTHSNWIVENYS